MKKGEKTVSERDVISKIRGLADKPSHNIIKGIGDDCAVICGDSQQLWLVTTDTLIESVHFDFAWHSPYLLGRKTASVNISDVAAMGGQPLFAQLSLAIANPSKARWLDDFLAGFAAVLDEFDMHLIGGDTVKGKNDNAFTVTVLGVGRGDQIIYRSGAQIGDLIWVSGPLGDAAAGLELCRRNSSPSTGQFAKWQQLRKALLDPDPQVALGKLLAESGLVHSMIDISDGLATDLAHLCVESKVGAEIYVDDIPISGPLNSFAASLEVPALDWALKGGEDYQLLFTSSSEVEDSLHRLVFEYAGRKIYKIGRILDGTGVFLCQRQGQRIDVGYQGYDHFVVEK